MMNEWFETKYIPQNKGKIKQTHILLSCFYQITNTSVKNEYMEVLYSLSFLTQIKPFKPGFVGETHTSQ